jgi:hypothetical protein
MSVLLFFASFLLGAIGILPNEQPVSALQQDLVPPGLWYTILVLYLIAFLVTMNIPRGPLIHFSPHQVYSEKTIATMTNFYADNVCGIVSASIWSILYFSYTTKVSSDTSCF